MKEPTTTVAVRIPQAAYETIVKIAEAHGTRRSDVLREIICKFVAEFPEYNEGDK